MLEHIDQDLVIDFSTLHLDSLAQNFYQIEHWCLIQSYKLQGQEPKYSNGFYSFQQETILLLLLSFEIDMLRDQEFSLTRRNQV